MEVTVSGLKATDTDMYRCEIEVFYPPPYLRLTGNGTLIHVLGETSPTHRYNMEIQVDHKRPADTQTLSSQFTYLSVLLSVLLSLHLFPLSTGSSDCPALAQRQIAHHHGDDEEEDEGMAPVSFPVVVLVILVMFVLLIIIYFQVRALFFYFYLYICNVIILCI